MSVAHGWAAATRRGRSSTLSPLSLGGRGGGRGRSLRLVQRVQNLLSVHAVSHGDEVLSALAHRIETRSALPPRQGPRQLNDRDSGLAGAASTRMCHRSSGAGPPHGRVRRSGGAHRCFTPSWSVIDLLRKAMPTMSTPAPALTSRVSHARERTVVAMVPARGSTVARLGPLWGAHSACQRACRAALAATLRGSARAAADSAGRPSCHTAPGACSATAGPLARGGEAGGAGRAPG